MHSNVFKLFIRLKLKDQSIKDTLNLADKNPKCPTELERPAGGRGC